MIYFVVLLVEVYSVCDPFALKCLGVYPNFGVREGQRKRQDI